MLNAQELGLIALMRSALDGKTATCPEELSLEVLLPAIKRQQIQLMAMAGLEHMGDALGREGVRALFRLCAQSIRIAESQRMEAEALFAAFDAAKIDYMPLKGILLQKLYPRENMRAMSDVDVLIRREQYEQIRPLMEKLGFLQGEESDHEYNWKKDQVLIELHKSLIPSYHTSLYAYFGDGWGRGAPVTPGAYRYKMSDEDQFIYLFTHYAKHFRDGGIGPQHLTDLWVYRRAKPDMDESEIAAGLKALHLDEFYNNVVQTAQVWFADAPLTEITENITHEILSGGAYGKEIARKKAEILRNSPKSGKGTKLRWMLNRIFLPYGNMCIKYPWLRRVPFLLPVMWPVRWLGAILTKSEKLSKNIKAVQSLSDSSVEEYRAYLASLGLEYEAKE